MLFVGGQNVWGYVLVIASVCIITMVVLYYRRHVQNLKTGMNHVVRYLANEPDPPSQVDPHHFDNPVYGFQPAPTQSIATDSSTLLNIRNHRPVNLDRSKWLLIKSCRLNWVDKFINMHFICDYSYTIYSIL